MFDQDEGKIECAHLKGVFLTRQESRERCVCDVGTRGISLSLALGTAKFKQLD